MDKPDPVIITGEEYRRHCLSMGLEAATSALRREFPNLPEAHVDLARVALTAAVEYLRDDHVQASLVAAYRDQRSEVQRLRLLLEECASRA